MRVRLRGRGGVRACVLTGAAPIRSNPSPPALPLVLVVFSPTSTPSPPPPTHTNNAHTLQASGRRQLVVILADKKKADMDAAVHETLRDRGARLEVHTRQGSPFKLGDLRRVRCALLCLAAVCMGCVGL